MRRRVESIERQRSARVVEVAALGLRQRDLLCGDVLGVAFSGPAADFARLAAPVCRPSYEREHGPDEEVRLDGVGGDCEDLVIALGALVRSVFPDAEVGLEYCGEKPSHVRLVVDGVSIEAVPALVDHIPEPGREYRPW